MVCFHPGVGHQEDLERALQQFSDVTFLVPGEFVPGEFVPGEFVPGHFVQPYIQGIMDRNSDVYFTYNDIFADLIDTFRFGEKQTFISDMRAGWHRLLDEAVQLYRP